MTMSIADMERLREELGLNDEVGPERESLFLCKLALTLAERLGDFRAFEDAIAVAMRDLDSG